jgi:hypothetical protein
MATAATALVAGREPGWIYRKSWDLPLLILSAVLVPLPFVFAWTMQASGLLTEHQAIDLINIAVAGLIGGPHLFSTFTMTFLNRPFLAQHRLYSAASLLLPVGVVYLGVRHYELLISCFFAWASIHVLHQIIYLTDCYRVQAGRPDPAWSRWVDYGVILTGLYPIGMYKLAQGKFQVGGVVLPFPDALRGLHLPLVAGAIFGIFMLIWVLKTLLEAQKGALSAPKTLLIGITSFVSFFLPMGSNLDVLFQGYNTWHSFQYLFLFWIINRLRFERGEIENRFVRSLVSRPSMSRYYLSCFAATLVLVAITLVVRAVTPLSANQSYFVVVLSALLIHYYFDHFLFTQTDLVR